MNPIQSQTALKSFWRVRGSAKRRAESLKGGSHCGMSKPKAKSRNRVPDTQRRADQIRRCWSLRGTVVGIQMVNCSHRLNLRPLLLGLLSFCRSSFHVPFTFFSCSSHLDALFSKSPHSFLTNNTPARSRPRNNVRFYHLSITRRRRRGRLRRHHPQEQHRRRFPRYQGPVRPPVRWPHPEDLQGCRL